MLPANCLEKKQACKMRKSGWSKTGLLIQVNAFREREVGKQSEKNTRNQKTRRMGLGKWLGESEWPSRGKERVN